ncbi:M23 family metallopeptidase, partial [archaeon]|nr:M23 family metallopeptidase [archaeon]
ALAAPGCTRSAPDATFEPVLTQIETPLTEAPKSSEQTESPPITEAPLLEVIWQEDSLVQPVPEHGSKVRLSLPVEIDEIQLDPMYTFQGFGAHINDKADGVETVTLTIKPGTKIKSLADGKVTRVYPGNSYMGCQLAIDYGDGLHGKHHFLKECIVTVGQEVKRGEVLGEGNSIEGAPPGMEFLIGDANRNDGPEGEYGDGQAVSMFDYLEEEDREAFIKLYIEKFVGPYLRKGENAGNAVFLWEPFLTNKLLIHEGNDGKLVGEWISTQKWVQSDGKPEVITFIEANHSLWDGTHMRAHELYNFKDIISGRWEADYEKGSVEIKGEDGTFYAIFEIDETEALAKLKFEYQTGSYPSTFSSGALTFVERDRIGMLKQGQEMGVFDFE